MNLDLDRFKEAINEQNPTESSAENVNAVEHNRMDI